MAGRIIYAAKKHGLHLTAFNTERFEPVIHPVGAQGAFPYDVFNGIIGRGTIWTRFNTLLAAVAFFLVDENNPILALKYGLRWACG